MSSNPRKAALVERVKKGEGWTNSRVICYKHLLPTRGYASRLRKSFTSRLGLRATWEHSVPALSMYTCPFAPAEPEAPWRQESPHLTSLSGSWGTVGSYPANVTDVVTGFHKLEETTKTATITCLSIWKISSKKTVANSSPSHRGQRKVRKWMWRLLSARTCW